MIGSRIGWKGPLAAITLVAGLAGLGLSAVDRPVPATPAETPEPVRRLGLVPSFSDMFDGGALDRHKWDRPHGERIDQRTLVGNVERQVYFDPAYLGLGIAPLNVGGGLLTITARPLSLAARALLVKDAETLPPNPINAPLGNVAYSSGRIMNRKSFQQRYGYFEMRARATTGRGLWPAFWLVPSSGAWPPEIDVMEILGHEPSTLYMTVHSGVRDKQYNKIQMDSASDQFHRYGVLWSPATIDYYLDGRKVASAETPADAHQPMYMIVNLAVGGSWPGDPDAATRFPATMQVDYVRAWRYPDRR